MVLNYKVPSFHLVDSGTNLIGDGTLYKRSSIYNLSESLEKCKVERSTYTNYG